MKTFLCDFLERRGIKKRLVSGWILRVRKEDVLNYRLRQYFRIFAMGFFIVLSFFVLPNIFGDLFTGVINLEGYQRGAGVMAFFCVYVWITESVIFTTSKVDKKSIKGANLTAMKVLPPWNEKVSCDDRVDGLKKMRRNTLITGLLLCFALPLFVFSGWADIYGFLAIFIAIFFSYFSLVALAIIGRYLISRSIYFDLLVFILMVPIFIVGIGCITGPDMLAIADLYFSHFPPYWFFLNGGLYSFGFVEWGIHGAIIISAAILWKPLWSRFVQSLKEVDSAKESEMTDEVIRSEASEKLMGYNSSSPFFSAFLWKRAIWFLGLLGLSCVCFHQLSYSVGLSLWLYKLMAFGAMIGSFVQLVILAFERFLGGIGKALKISQSRDAFEIGLFPFNTKELLKHSVLRGLGRILLVGILGGGGFVMINIYGGIAPFQDGSVFEFFYIGVLIFSLFEISVKLCEVLYAHMPRRSDFLKKYLLGSFFLSVHLILGILPFCIGFIPFLERPEGEDTFAVWMNFCMCYGIAAVIAISWILYTHRKKVITLTYLRQS